MRSKVVWASLASIPELCLSGDIPELAEGLMGKANGPLSGAAGPLLCSCPPCTPEAKEPWHQKPPNPFGIPTRRYQQGIWEVGGPGKRLKIIKSNSIRAVCLDVNLTVCVKLESLPSPHPPADFSSERVSSPRRSCTLSCLPSPRAPAPRLRNRSLFHAAQSLRREWPRPGGPRMTTSPKRSLGVIWT